MVTLFGPAWERTDLLRWVGDLHPIGGAPGRGSEREFQRLSSAGEILAVENEIRSL